jgi:hypothetical protein
MSENRRLQHIFEAGRLDTKRDVNIRLRRMPAVLGLSVTAMAVFIAVYHRFVQTSIPTLVIILVGIITVAFFSQVVDAFSTYRAVLRRGVVDTTALDLLDVPADSEIRKTLIE